MKPILHTKLKTPLGTATISGNKNGIYSIQIADAPPETGEIGSFQPVPKCLQQAAQQLEAYFTGDLKEFSLKLNPQGTAFQKKVWQSLTGIPYGKTLSYLELSHKLGNPKAIRAVAAANAKNPLWIIVPCHRVVGSDGSLTGYAGGLQRKKWLLEHECPPAQQQLF